MKMSTYTQKVRAGLADAAALADDPTQQVADKLATAVDSSTRLAIISALGDAAEEINAQLGAGTVRLSLNGEEPAFEVTAPVEVDADFETYDPEAAGSEEGAEFDYADDEPQARVSLRLPQSVKGKVDEAASAEGVSVNTWLLQRILLSLAWGRRGGRGRGPRGPRGPFGPGFMPPMPPGGPGRPGFGPEEWGRGPGRDHWRERGPRGER